MIGYEQVFTPGKLPSDTYNERSETQLVPQLNNTLTAGGKIAILTGQTKIGKTVLVRKVIPDDKRIEIQAGDLTDTPIEKVIARKLGAFPIEKRVIETLQEDDSEKNAFEAGFGARIKFWKFLFAKVNVSRKNENSSLKSNIINEIFEDDLFTRVMEYINENNYILVFDDFHYLEGEKQRKLIHRLKDPLSLGAKIVIVLIPNRNEDVITAEPDMQGRTKEIVVPSWNKEELRFIPESGFKKLNISLDSIVIDDIVENGFRNPDLVQDICSHLCQEFQINQAKETLTHINVSKTDLKRIYRELNTTNSLIDSIERGKITKGSGRKLYQLKESDKKVDTYALIIRALGNIANKDAIQGGELVEEVHTLVKNNNGEPRRSDIIATVKRMVDIAKKQNSRDPALTYEDDLLKMYDPFFSFDIRWRHSTD